MINIDDRIKSKGPAFLRSLNGSKIRQMAQEENIYIIRGGNSEPAMVLIPYEMYLKVQENAKKDLATSIQIAKVKVAQEDGDCCPHPKEDHFSCEVGSFCKSCPSDSNIWEHTFYRDRVV